MTRTTPLTPLTHCVCCGQSRLYPVLDLSDQPLANSYVRDPHAPEDRFPLAINYCADCTHLQLTHAVHPDLLFRNYLYVSGTTQTLRDYFSWFVDFVQHYTTGTRVLDIACNDGSQLDAFKRQGYQTYGVDPAKNLHALSSRHHTVVCDYFTAESAAAVGTTVDVIVAQNVFAHTADPLAFLEACKTALNPSGLVFLQTSQADMVERNEFDTIYHEHISFFSVQSFCTLAHRAGFRVVDVVRTPIHGTSFVVVLSLTAPDRSAELMAKESPRTLGRMLQYAHACQTIADTTATLVRRLQNDGYSVIGYGAAAKGHTFLNFAKFSLDYVIDDNPLKQGLYTPGTHIPITAIDRVREETGPICIVPLAWNFFDEIKTRVSAQLTRPVSFLRYFPHPRIEQMTHDA